MCLYKIQPPNTNWIRLKLQKYHNTNYSLYINISSPSGVWWLFCPLWKISLYAHNIKSFPWGHFSIWQWDYFSYVADSQCNPTPQNLRVSDDVNLASRITNKEASMSSLVISSTSDRTTSLRNLKSKRRCNVHDIALNAHTEQRLLLMKRSIL